MIRVLDAVIGDGSLTMMAGPCSVESRDQLFETADAVAAAGATVLRGGAFKPRTSPYSFQGLGVEALRYLAEARERTGLPVITEVMEPNQVDIVAEYADILQIGTRNMQNYSLLTAVGRVARPVMLKRGYGATVEEWLMAAEYIVSSGNPNVILCERGIRTFETYTRNTIDLAAVPLLHHLTHLPVIVDPSHATGKRWLVTPLALGGVAVGADGVMVEVHPDPDAALSDAEQQLTLDQFRAMMAQLVPVHEHVRGMYDDPPSRRPRASGPATGSAGIDDDHDLSVDIVRYRRDRTGRAAARRAAAARRQVDQPSGPDARDAGRRREPDQRRGRRRRRALDGRRSAGALGANVERLDVDRAGGRDGRLPGRLAGRRRAPRAGERPRLRQLRDQPPPVRRDRRRTAVPDASSTATIRCDGDRSLVSSNRCARWARRSTRRADDSLPPLTVIGRSPLDAVDTLDAGSERPGEVGDPAGGAPGGRVGRRSARRSRRAITPSGCSGRGASRSGRRGWRPTRRRAGRGRWRSRSKEGGR